MSFLLVLLLLLVVVVVVIVVVVVVVVVMAVFIALWTPGKAVLWGSYDNYSQE